jgi:hypothetical protein
LREKLPIDAKILGPSASILSVLSGRHVYDQRELMPKGPDSSSPAKIEAAKLDYLIVPAKLYLKKEPAIARMMTKRILGAKGEIAKTKEMRLGRMVVTLPPPGIDWRKWKPPPRRKRAAPTSTNVAGKQAAAPAKARQSTTLPASRGAATGRATRRNSTTRNSTTRIATTRNVATRAVRAAPNRAD